MAQLTTYVTASGDDGSIDGTTFYDSLNSLYWGEWQTGMVQHIWTRFDNITIPAGSTINSAYLYLYYEGRNSGTDDLPATVYAEDADDPDAYASYSEWSNRTPTTASVTWYLDESQGWTNNTYYSSPDIKTIIQEIVDRGGWASGQAIMLYLEDEGNTDGNEITFESYDAGPGTNEPYLVINYTAPWTSKTDETVSVAASADDGHIDDTNFYNSGSTLYFGQWQTSGVQHIFTRFDPVDVPQYANILSAKLSLYFITRDSGTDDLDSTIYGEDADDPNAIDSYSSGSDPWTGRTQTTASVAWTLDAGGWTDGTYYDSPDIKTIVQEIVNRSGWATGQAMMFYIEDEGPTPVGNECSFDTGTNDPILTITYTVDDALPSYIQLIAG